MFSRISFRCLLKCAAVAVSLTGLSASPAAAKTIFIKVGASVGGGHDAAGRLVARHLATHLGGDAEVVVENVAGAGGLTLVKLMAETEPADGSSIGLIIPGQILNAVLEPDKAGESIAKLKWVGSLTGGQALCVTGKDSGIETFDQFLTGSFKVGATSASGGFYQQASLIKRTLGAKYQIITGFKGLAEIQAAIDRGEVSALCGGAFSDFLERNETRNLIAASRPVKGDSAGQVALFRDHVTSDTDRAAMDLFFSRDAFDEPFVLPPDTPDDIVAQYRQAFEAMLKDDGFIEDSKKLYDDLTPMSGADLEAEVKAVLASDPAVVDRLKTLIGK